jgi:hypothetical protein
MGPQHDPKHPRPGQGDGSLTPEQAKALADLREAAAGLEPAARQRLRDHLEEQADRENATDGGDRGNP